MNEYKEIFLMPFNALACCLSEILPKRGFKVVGFYDNNDDLENKNFRGTPISKPVSVQNQTEVDNSLNNGNLETSVIICSYRQTGIAPQLNRLGIKFQYYYDFCSKEDIPELLEALEGISESEFVAVHPVCAQMKAYSSSVIKNAFVFCETDKDVVISALNVVITEKCNLNCRDCSFLRPYFTNLRTYETTKIVTGFSALLRGVSYIREALLIGGEPFIHPDIDKIARYIADSKKVGMILVISNGALLPKKHTIQGLAGIDNLTVKISDYGDLSKHKQAIADMCKEFGVKCAIQEQMPWWEAGVLLSTPQSYEDSLNVFVNCNMNCALLAEGKFAKCSAAMWRHLLSAVPPLDWGDDILDVYDEQFANNLRKYMQSTEPLKACCVCSGKSRTAKQIPPAVQHKGTLPYNKY